MVVLVFCGCAPPNHQTRSLFDGYRPVERPQTRNTSGQDADFGFRYEAKTCPFEVIDTFKETYRTCGMKTPIPMKLTDDERAIIFRAIVASDFFDLPQAVNQPEAAEWKPDTYELAVWNVSYHRVLWRLPSLFPSTDEDFVKLLLTIRRVVHSRPDVARVQPRGCGCAGRC
jgi:hypothetical protein